MELTERQKRFEQAKKLREQQKKEESYGNFAPIDIPEFETVNLKKDKSQILRLLGNSLEMHEKDSDPIIVNRSLIKGDDDKWFTLIWSPDTDHPMNKLKSLVVGKYTYIKESKQKIYDNKDLPVFKRFMTNGQDSIYTQGMMPQKYILMNCISRGENDTWCRDNKHSKLLCWSATEKEVDGKIKVYPEYGVKSSFYKEVWDVKCTLRNRHFEDFDILVRRLSKENKMGDSYLCINFKEEKSVINNWERKDGCSYLEYMNDEYLSDEEKSYERYNLKDIPFISKPTPCGVILRHLGKFIKEVDKTFNTNLYAEFVDLKAKEMAESKEESESNTEDSSSTSTPTSSVEVESSVNEDLPSDTIEEPKKDSPTVNIPTSTPISKKVKKVVNVFDPMSLVATLPTIAELSEADRNLIIGVDEENGELIYSEPSDLSCPTCGSSLCDSLTRCPYCGQGFEE